MSTIKEESCPSCQKKQQLILKYTNLIELLKKKNERKDNSHSKSNDQPCSVLSNKQISTNQIALLPQMIVQLNKKTEADAFRKIFRRAVEQKCHRGFKLTQILERCISKRVQEGTRMLWIANNKHPKVSDKLTAETEKNVSSVLLDVSSNPRNISCFVQSSGNHSNDKINALSRRCFALNRQMEGLKWSKKVLEDQIEENYRRQQIESKKKKESLEMLAQQMAQKNQLINQLQTTLQFYESKQGRNINNVLEEDGVALQKEIDQLQKINEKINIQLEKKTQHLNRAQQQLKILNEKASQLQKENKALKEKNFEMNVELEGLQKKKHDYYNLTSFLEKKMSNLKKYEKIINNHIKVIEQHSIAQKSSFNASLRLRNSAPVMLDDVADNLNEQKAENSFAIISKFQAQYKIQKILNYIFNIELQDVWINNEQNLFDNEQIQVLNSLKLKFMQINEQIKTLKKQKHEKNQQQNIKPGVERLSKECGDEDEVYFNQHHVSGSIFEVLATQKPNKELQCDPVVSQFEPKGCPNCNNQKNQKHNNHNGDLTTRRDHQNFTIRLLELQVEKNKQIEKISQLKNKIMHIRCIVMNFMKSLQFKSLKAEAKDIAELFFELFEYSEQQKQLILHQNQAQKRLWGFF